MRGNARHGACTAKTKGSDEEQALLFHPKSLGTRPGYKLPAASNHMLSYPASGYQGLAAGARTPCTLAKATQIIISRNLQGSMNNLISMFM